MILVCALNKFGYFVIFNSTIVIKKNKSFVCSGTLDDNLYYLFPKINSLHNTKLNNESNYHKKIKLSPNEMYLWHLHLSHISIDKI